MDLFGPSAIEVFGPTLNSPISLSDRYKTSTPSRRLRRAYRGFEPVRSRRSQQALRTQFVDQ